MDDLPTKIQADTSRSTSAERARGQTRARFFSASLDQSRPWWLKLLVQPALVLVSGAALLVALGIAQRAGWISSSGNGQTGVAVSGASAELRYICPMMCTPPQAEPGRCPVCAMELVPATSTGSNTDHGTIQIEPAARRVANIQTVTAKKMPIHRVIQASGELSYDEGTLKQISAYVDGRLERLYADYTGIVVQKGDALALFYSPSLYSSQLELLLAKKARATRSRASSEVAQSNEELYRAARQRLSELGVTQDQIEALEQSGTPSSRMQLRAPISGTVIKKAVVEGQYVKEGDVIYGLADLSSLWLMLRLFPEDVAFIRYGQKVEAEVQSMPGRNFTGRVAFVSPSIDPTTRTVAVRVVVPNENGLLHVGDYAKAVIHVPLAATPQSEIYDPELADKWISPRHPHVIREAPGLCPVCGTELLAAAEFGFTSDPGAHTEGIVIARDCVLMAGSHSIVYVETEPGYFEIRPVILGPAVGDQISIRSGLQEGEIVAARGNFLIDSQMQLAGNPSLIDPAKAAPRMEEMDLPPIGELQLLEPLVETVPHTAHAESMTEESVR